MYEKSYKQAFIAYYDRHYAPKNAQGPETPIPRNGLNSRLKHLHGSRPRAIVVSEALVYIESDSEIEPPEPPAEAIELGHNPSPGGFFYEANILDWWKVNAGRFPNLARMARDVLAVQGGRVGVERVFSMARDVIRYRCSRLKSSTIRASMLVKSYEHEELRRELANHDGKREAERLEEMAAFEDYRFLADRKGQSSEDDGCCISDDDESQKKDIASSFVDQDGRRAFAREPRPILPAHGSIRSQYARPEKSQIQDATTQLDGSEESGEDYDDGIWDSMVNIYEASGEETETETEEEPGGEDSEISTGLRDLGDGHPEAGRENSREGGTGGLAGHREEGCLVEDAESEIGDSLLVMQVTRHERAVVGAITRKRAGTGGKEKKRFRLT